MWHRDDGSQALHRDALGSIVATTDGSGKLKSEIVYDAFGNITEATGQSANKFGYTGHQMDAETGLVYFQARYYDPQLGRFITQDPYEGDWNTPLSLHHYLYAYANPGRFVDLNGYDAVDTLNGIANSVVNFFLGGDADMVSDYTQLQAWQAANPNRTWNSGTAERVYQVDLRNWSFKKEIVTGKTTTEKLKNTLTLGIPALGENIGNFAGAAGVALDNDANPAILRQAHYDLGSNGVGVGIAVAQVGLSKRSAAAGGQTRVPSANAPVAKAPGSAGVASAAEGTVVTVAEARSGGGVRAARKPNEKAGTEQQSAEVRRVNCDTCFVAGTLVAVDGGFKAIEDVRIGDLVLSKSEETGEITYKPVTDLILTRNKGVFDLTIRTPEGGVEVLSVTDNHPFWVLNKGSFISGLEEAGWVESGNLKPGMRVQTGAGDGLLVESLVSTGQSPDTYNLTVSEFHSYFVGKNRIWVHNVKCGELGESATYRDAKGRLRDARTKQYAPDPESAASRGELTPVQQLRRQQQPEFDGRRAATLERDKLCVYCQKKKATEQDHFNSVQEVYGRVAAGEMTMEEAARFLASPENLVGACGGLAGCNPSKGGKRATLLETDKMHWRAVDPTPEMKARIEALDSERIRK
ncbi:MULTISPECIES: polymorphic toxin-type HINT domain-containing protein [unclassified Duganella]